MAERDENATKKRGLNKLLTPVSFPRCFCLSDRLEQAVQHSFLTVGERRRPHSWQQLGIAHCLLDPTARLETRGKRDKRRQYTRSKLRG